ncbi:MAG: hypothetical protein RLZZ214_538, partial [Verrucomicrobiota bacterium]
SPSSPLKSPAKASRPLNRDFHRERVLRNSVPASSAKSSSDRPIGGIEEDQVAQSPSEQGWKRVLDASCILISLPFVLIVMVLIVLWIRLVSSGPALFRQERIGKDGKRFVLYKFRTMKLNSGTSRHEKHLKHLVESNSPMIKLDLLCDSRLIPAGCLLRAAGLDELPQLFNVLRGEMSLVGPRPCLPAEYAFFSHRQRERFKALPGLTGSWQVSGKNQTTFNEMNLLDIQYIRKISPLLDLQIMLRTPWVLLLQMSQAMQQRIKSNRNAGNLTAKRKDVPTGSYQKVG